MAAVSSAALMIFASCVIAVSSLQCYRCVRENKPDALKYCKLSTSAPGNNEVVKCTSDDRCTIVKTILKDGSVTTFRRSCATAKGCSNKCTSPDAEGTVICDSCCEKDLCNTGDGPKASELSGTSRITIIRGLYMFWGFTVWILA